MLSKKEIELLSAVEVYENILVGTIRRFPPCFWKCDFSFDYAREIGVYIINKHFSNDSEQIKNHFGVNFINSIKLHSALKLFNGSAFEYIDFLFPNRFKAWEFKSTPQNYWNEDTAILATKWLIEEIKLWSPSDVKELLDSHVFVANGLSGMLAKVCNYSVFTALALAYPDRYKPWELRRVPVSFWKERDNIRHALKWMFYEKLEWDAKEIMENITNDLLTREGFSGMLRWYNGIPYDVLQELFPEINWVDVQSTKPWHKKR